MISLDCRLSPKGATLNGLWRFVGVKSFGCPSFQMKETTLSSLSALVATIAVSSAIVAVVISLTNGGGIIEGLALYVSVLVVSGIYLAVLSPLIVAASSIAARRCGRFRLYPLYGFAVGAVLYPLLNLLVLLLVENTGGLDYALSRDAAVVGAFWGAVGGGMAACMPGFSAPCVAGVRSLCNDLKVQAVIYNSRIFMAGLILFCAFAWFINLVVNAGLLTLISHYAPALYRQRGESVWFVCGYWFSFARALANWFSCRSILSMTPVGSR
jgi:hypothetical protein